MITKRIYSRRSFYVVSCVAGPTIAEAKKSYRCGGGKQTKRNREKREKPGNFKLSLTAELSYSLSHRFEGFEQWERPRNEKGVGSPIYVWIGNHRTIAHCAFGAGRDAPEERRSWGREDSGGKGKTRQCPRWGPNAALLSRASALLYLPNTARRGDLERDSLDAPEGRCTSSTSTDGRDQKRNTSSVSWKGLRRLIPR